MRISRKVQARAPICTQPKFVCTIHCSGVDIAYRVSYNSTKRNFVVQICVWTKWTCMYIHASLQHLLKEWHLC